MRNRNARCRRGGCVLLTASLLACILFFPPGAGAEEPEVTTFRHAELFSADSPASGPFSYLHGRDGVYEPLSEYRADWGGWTNKGGPPTIGAGYLSANTNDDAALVFRAPESGLLDVSSELPLKLQFGAESDGARMIVTVRTAEGERPVWPRDGEWAYHAFTGTEETGLSLTALPVHAGDEVRLILQSVGNSLYDTVDFAPVFTLDASGGEPEKTLAPVERAALTAADYVANLPDVGDRRLDPPAGAPAPPVPAAEPEPVEPLWMAPALWFFVAGGLVLLAAALGLTLCLRHKRRNRTKGGRPHA